MVDRYIGGSPEMKRFQIFAKLSKQFVFVEQQEISFYMKLPTPEPEKVGAMPINCLPELQETIQFLCHYM